MPGVTFSIASAARSAYHLSPEIKVVNPAELVWVTRWRHDPKGTEALLQNTK